MSEKYLLSSWKGSDRFSSVSKWTNFEGKKILDIGCDGCNFEKMFKLADRNDVYGIDLSPSSNDRRIKLKKCNIENGIPFDDLSFDAVIMLEVIEHIEKRDFVLDETHRILKDGGILIITTPNRNSVEGFFSRFFYCFKRGYWNAWDETHKHIFAQGEFRRFIERRFKVEDYETAFFLVKKLDSVKNTFFKKFMRAFRIWTDRNMGRNHVLQSLGFDMMILCRK